MQNQNQNFSKCNGLALLALPLQSNLYQARLVGLENAILQKRRGHILLAHIKVMTWPRKALKHVCNPADWLKIKQAFNCNHMSMLMFQWISSAIGMCKCNQIFAFLDQDLSQTRSWSSSSKQTRWRKMKSEIWKKGSISKKKVGLLHFKRVLYLKIMCKPSSAPCFGAVIDL